MRTTDLGLSENQAIHGFTAFGREERVGEGRGGGKGRIPKSASARN